MKTKLLIIVSIFVLASCTQTTTNLKEDTLHVVGKASVKAIPEDVSISIPIEVSNRNFKICSDQLLTKIEQVKVGFKKIGFDEDQIKTDNYNIHEKYEYINNKRTKTGYTGTLTIHLQNQYNTDMVNQIIDLLKELETTYSIDFVLSEEQKTALTNASIEKAITNANEKANTIAKQLNVSIVRVANVDYDSNVTTNGILLRQFNDVELKESSTLNFNPSEIEINKTVNIVWVIRN